MEIFLNIGSAKISLILGILASVIYVLRIANKKFFYNKNRILNKINRILRRYHKTIGIVVVITGLVHGIYSSDAVLSLNMGTVCWIFSVLLGVNWALRKKVRNWIFYHRILTLGFIITLIIHILLVQGVITGFDSKEVKPNRNNINSWEEHPDKKGGIRGNSSKTKRKDTPPESELDNSDSNQENKNQTVSYENQVNNTKEYKDGVYEGIGNGYKPGIVVKVTVEEGKVASIEIIDDNETPRFSTEPFETIPQQIINSQSTDVDMVSGATMTSEGVVEAVKDALLKAQK